MFIKKFKNLLLIGSTLLLVACGNSDEENNETNGVEESQENTNLVVASHLPPMTDIVELAAENIEEPYTIELLEVSDNVQYNEAVQNKEAFASFAQHKPFMEQYNEANNGNLVQLQPMYDAIVGFYSPVYDSIDDIEEGAEIAIPNDISNQARALLMLENEDLIELDDNVEPTSVSINDVTSNPMNFEFTEVDLLNLTAAYEDGVELVFNLPTYIASIDLTPNDAVFLEDTDDMTFAISLVGNADDQDSEATQALVDAFTSQAVYDYLVELSDINHLYPAFDNPAE